jgi:hypothetical protein
MKAMAKPGSPHGLSGGQLDNNAVQGIENYQTWVKFPWSGIVPATFFFFPPMQNADWFTGVEKPKGSRPFPSFSSYPYHAKETQHLCNDS